MKMICKWQSKALIAILLTWSPFHAQQPPAGGAPERERVSMNQVWNSLPDFVCKEKIVSSAVEKGKTK